MSNRTPFLDVSRGLRYWKVGWNKVWGQRDKGVAKERSSIPRIEMIGSIDAASGALRSADGPVLLKGRSALNRGFVGAGGLVDVVC